MGQTAIGNYFRTAFRWQRGRQNTGYDKMLLFTLPWPSTQHHSEGAAIRG